MSFSVLPEPAAGDATRGERGRASKAVAEDTAEQEDDDDGVAEAAEEAAEHWTARDARRGREVCTLVVRAVLVVSSGLVRAWSSAIASPRWREWVPLICSSSRWSSRPCLICLTRWMMSEFSVVASVGGTAERIAAATIAAQTCREAPARTAAEIAAARRDSGEPAGGGPAG